MVARTDPERARWAGRLRLGVLALVALLSAHTAIYAAQFGLGDRFAQAMASGGHDGWWMPTSVVILGIGFLLLIHTLGGLAHLEVSARAAGRGAGAGRVRFAPEIRSIWGRLFPLVTILFLAQENFEHAVTDGHLLGLDPLIGPDSAIALPMLALITLGLAVLGAMFRWRVAVLRARTASSNHQARRAVVSQIVAGRWTTVGALAPRQWMTDRLDAGRAPPGLLRF